MWYEKYTFKEVVLVGTPSILREGVEFFEKWLKRRELRG